MSKQLGLITFDLDDTLFPILPVVQEANEAMFDALAQHGYGDATEEGYHASCKQIRKELYEKKESNGGTVNPITYSELRKRGIALEMKACESSHPTKDRQISNLSKEEIVDLAFDAWLFERHASADRHLFSHTLEMLETLSQKHSHAFVVAVTNGRGNPSSMPQICDYFDLCVSGEDPDVFPHRKPHPKIFEATLLKTHKYQQQTKSKATHSIFNANDNGTLALNPSYCWIHVGDDLANDVGASKNCGAKTIWMHQEELEELKKTPNFVTTASKEEQEARWILNEQSMGAVDVTINCLSELGDAIATILKQQ